MAALFLKSDWSFCVGGVQFWHPPKGNRVKEYKYKIIIYWEAKQIEDFPLIFNLNPNPVPWEITNIMDFTLN